MCLICIFNLIRLFIALNSSLFLQQKIKFYCKNDSKKLNFKIKYTFFKVWHDLFFTLIKQLKDSNFIMHLSNSCTKKAFVFFTSVFLLWLYDLLVYISYGCDKCFVYNLNMCLFFIDEINFICNINWVDYF